MPGLDLLDIEGQWVGFRAPQQSGIEGGMGGVLLLWDIGDEGLSQLHRAGVWKSPCWNTRSGSWMLLWNVWFSNMGLESCDQHRERILQDPTGSCVQLWDPQDKKGVEGLEHVQRRRWS